MTRILISLLGFSVSVQALATCFYPDGVSTDAGHVPCNQTGTAASACCDPLDSCSQSGFCLGRSGWNYRGTCTDRTWASNNCAIKYDSCLTDPFLKVKYSGYTAVWACPVNGKGTREDNWCCATGDSSTSCCNSSFENFVTGGAFMPGLDQFVLNITKAAQQNSSSTSSSSPTSSSSVPTDLTASSTSNKSGNSDLGTKVGLGVGIPLGVLVLGLLAWLFFREMKRRHVGGVSPDSGAGYRNVETSSPMEQHAAIASPMQSHLGAPPYTSYNGATMQQQTFSPHAPKITTFPGAETPVYEAPSGNNVHEMRG